LFGDTALAVVGLSLVLALAFAVVVVRAWRRSRRASDGDRVPLNEERRTPGGGALARQGLPDAVHPEVSKPAPHRSESHADRVQELEAPNKAEEQARIAAEQLQAKAEEEQRRLTEEATRLASEQEALRRAEGECSSQTTEAARLEAELESRRVAKEEAQLAAERVLQRRAEEEQRRLIEEAARLVSEQETVRQVEERSRQAAEAARLEAEQESRRVAEEEAQLAAEQELQRRAEEEQRRLIEEAARFVSEQETVRQVEEGRGAAELARAEAERESRRRADDEIRAAAEQELREAKEQASRDLQQPEHTKQEIDAPTSRQSGTLEHDPIDVQAEDDPLTGEEGVVDPTARAPRQYRPTGRAPSAPRGATRSSAQPATRERAAPIEVRLVLERAGFCRVSLLPRRAAGMPPKLAVTGSGDPVELAALQDDWYQDVNLPGLGLLLEDGIEWAGSHNGSSARFSLSGRELYVLAPHGELRGFVSAPRLTLGEEHIVLCTAGRLPEVRAAIAITGSAEPTLLNSDSGIPNGWYGLRGVAPRNPIPPSPEGDILDALRPLAEVTISLEGGIRIDRQTWLCGFPPSIRLRGDSSMIGAVMIDNQAAAIGQGGGYMIPGWDSLGEHSIWCTSDSRTYSIRSGAEEWESWNAYTWSLGESDAGDVMSRPAVCGVLVRPPKAARAGGHGIVVPASNPVLIGAAPGEIASCTPRRDVRAGLCIGFPWFKPVWALPSDATHCDKRSSRVLLVGSPLPVEENRDEVPQDAVRRRQARQGAEAWSNAILTSGRKGLETEPAESEVANLWRTYKHFAKTRWRRRR
jgi:hypothetical protein